MDETLSDQEQWEEVKRWVREGWPWFVGAVLVVSGACVAVILGDGELDRGVAAVKTLRREAGQSECALADVAGRVQTVLEEESWTTT